jgi:hypothetical protein
LLLPLPEDDELDLVAWLRDVVSSLFARDKVPAEP